MRQRQSGRNSHIVRFFGSRAVREGKVQENEQRRIARELHDRVGQRVTGLSLGPKSLEQPTAKAVADEVGRHVLGLQTLAGEIGCDIHWTAVDLRPTALDDLGLREAPATLLREWSRRHGCRRRSRQPSPGSCSRR